MDEGNSPDQQKARHGRPAADHPTLHHRRGGADLFRHGGGHPWDGGMHRLPVPGLAGPAGTEGAGAPGGTGPHPLRQLHRHPEGRGLLLRQPLLRGRQPRCQDPAQPERGRGQRQELHQGPGRPGRRAEPEQRGNLEKDLPEDHDPEQHQAEDQRLPGQPRGDRHRRDLAGGGHGKGRL